MRRRGQQTVWWPFTQHAAVSEDDVSFIESAHGDLFKVIRPAGTMEASLASGSAAGGASGSGGVGVSGVQESWVSDSRYQYGKTGEGVSKVGAPTKAGGRAAQDTDFLITDMFDGCASWWTQVR
jgi:hypothetical protein